MSFRPGAVSITPGIYNTNSDSIRITIYGKGGHGASPHTTVDPIVIAARTILALQTIASREVKPGEMAIVTVGYIRAGTKNNIIPDQAEMGLTVRTYKPDVRKQVLAAISRITKAEAEAAGAPREPVVEHYEGTDAVYNKPGLAERLALPWKQRWARTRSQPQARSRHQKISRSLSSRECRDFISAWAAPTRTKFAEAKVNGTHLPSNHSALFAPDVDPALHTGIAAEVAVLRYLLNTSPSELHKLGSEHPPSN